ncbi:hypothetical protein [uncultured Roseobacter sp.]|uniref:hypothetical protein n=1 Tax=uncultured Roseobacter sp. TaxID=114847 RepID=UPI00263733FD|nr:hypothetical protein [uncultured Roseobacter sp.]
MYSAPEDGGPRRLVVTAGASKLHLKPQAGSETAHDVSQGAVLKNLGCTQELPETWCHVAPLRKGPGGYLPADQLAPARGPDGVVPHGPDTSRTRARKKDFDAADTLPCAQEQGQSFGTCQAAVARSGGGDATVVVTFANGFARQLWFTHGAFMRASATMSGVGTDMDWELREGIYMIRVDDQRFEISQAFVLGN